MPKSNFSVAEMPAVLATHGSTDVAPVWMWLFIAVDQFSDPEGSYRLNGHRQARGSRVRNQAQNLAEPGYFAGIGASRCRETLPCHPIIHSA